MSVDKAAIRSLLRWADNERGRFVSFENTLARQIDDYGANLPETTWRKIVEDNKGQFTLARRYTNDVKKGEGPLLLEEIKGEKTNVVTKEGLRGFTASGEVSVSREGNEEIESSTGLYRVGARGERGERTRVGEPAPALPREEQDYYDPPAALDKQVYDRYLSQKQKQFFKYSQARDESGRLLPLYHGTREVFTEFSKEKVGRTGAPDTQVGEAYFFTTSKLTAEAVASINKDGEIDTSSVNSIEVYLNIENPVIYDPSDWQESDEINTERLANAIKLAKEQGRDGVIYRSNRMGDTYVVFSPNQIKSVENESPTQSDDIRYDIDRERESLALIPESRVSTLHNARKSLAKAAMANRASLTMKGAFLYGGQQWVTSSSFIARFYDKVSGKIEGTPRDENNIAWVEDFADFSENISRTLPKWKKVATEKGSKVEISLKELAEAIAAARRDGGQRLYANINGVFFSAVEMEAVLSSIHEPSVYVFQKDNGRVLWAEGANGEAVLMGRSGDRIEVSQIVYVTKGSETTAVDKDPKIGQNINVNGGDNEERIQRRTDSRGEEDTGKHGEEQGESRDTNEVSTVPLGDSTNSEPNAEADSSTAIPRYLGLSEESQKYLEEQGFTYFDFYSPTSEDF